MAFWNSAHLSQPPSNTCKINISKNDIHKLKQVFENTSTIFSDLKPLHAEAAMISRTIYKLKSKFHSDSGFQKLEKVNRALLNYLAADFPAVYSQFADLLPPADQFGMETYMPTRQMLEWVLVRTQGFAQLFCVVAKTCEDSSRFWMNRITIGQSWNVSMLVMGVVARTWSYAKYLVVEACKWYLELKPYLDVLRPLGRAWTPGDYVFPEDLKLWLNVPHITEVKQIKPESVNTDVKNAFRVLEASCSADLKNPMRSSAAVQPSVDIDLGEVISRSELKLINSRIQKEKKMKQVVPPQMVNSENKLKTKRKKKRRELATSEEKKNEARKANKLKKKNKLNRKLK